VLEVAVTDDGTGLTAADHDGRGHGLAIMRERARTLGVSLKTVQNHVSRILDKLQAADRTQAALRARGVPPQAR
jgi:nitrate/nitrite-specific signal transduction histidine kinase